MTTEICHLETNAGSYHYINLVVMQQSLLQYSSEILGNNQRTGEDKRRGKIKDFLIVIVFWCPERTIDRCTIVFLTPWRAFLSKTMKSGWIMSGIAFSSVVQEQDNIRYNTERDVAGTPWGVSILERKLKCLQDSRNKKKHLMIKFATVVGVPGVTQWSRHTLITLPAHHSHHHLGFYFVGWRTLQLHLPQAQ